MSLADRLDAARHRAPATAGPIQGPVATTTPAPVAHDIRPETQDEPAPLATAPKRRATADTTEARPVRSALPSSPSDPLADTKERAIKTLFQRIGTRINDSALTEDQLHTLVRDELAKIVDDGHLLLNREERQRLIQDIEDDALGLGPIQRLLDDTDITEIMVNSHAQIYVEKLGKVTLSPYRFASEEHLRRAIERIVAKVGRRIDESSPLVDARLMDGSRVNAIIPPLAVNGSSLTIRKFSDTPYQVQDLINFGTLTEPIARLLDGCVNAKLNILVSGGTGTGKTTLLNVLSSFIGGDERIVTIEDAVELKLQQTHVVRLESRPPNIEGRGEVTIRDLVRNSLRMRPDRIVIGEVRGGESLDMLQAMNTGHDGSISTLHANTPRDAIARLETMVLMAGMDLPLRAVREQVASAVDLIVQIARLRDGTRRVTQVTEITGMEGETVVLQDAFLFDYSEGLDEHGRFKGAPRATGLRPRFLDRFDELGVPYDLAMFDPKAS